MASHFDKVAGYQLTLRGKLSPLWFVQLYLLGTVVMFIAGPLMHKVENSLLLFSFLAAVHVAVYMGYHVGIKRHFSFRRIGSVDAANSDRIVNIVTLAGAGHMLANSLALIFIFQSGGGGTVLEALVDQGAAYAAKELILQRAVDNSGPIFQFLNLTSALSMAVLPMLTVFWERLRWIVRLVAIAAVLAFAAFYVLIGTQKGFGDIVILVSSSMLARHYRLRSREDMEASERQRTKWSKAKKRTFLAVAVVAGGAFLFYMAENLAGRSESFGSGSSALVSSKPSPLLNDIFGERIGYGMEIALAYPSHGYYGLSLNLDTPFEWTYGFGATRVLNDYKVQYLGGDDYFEDTYPVRTEYLTGWPWGVHWSTIYPWLASDVTFPGVIIVMAFMGYVLARLWADVILESNIVSLMLFGQLAIFFAYVPANNQLGIDKASFIGVTTLVMLYVLRGRRSQRQVMMEDRDPSLASGR